MMEKQINRQRKDMSERMKQVIAASVGFASCPDKFYFLEPILEYLCSYVSLADFLDWEEGQVYANGSLLLRVEKGLLERFAPDINEWVIYNASINDYDEIRKNFVLIEGGKSLVQLD